MKRFKRPINKKSSDNILIKNINKEIRAINQQIKSLMKKGFEEKSIAYQNLLKRLDNNKISKIDKQGKIKLLSGKETIAQKRAMRTAVDRFNESLTKSKEGINERRKRAKKGINKIFEEKLNDDQLNRIADLFENEKFQAIHKKIDRQKDSDFLIILADNLLKGGSADNFLNDLKMYNLIDADDSEEIGKLYDELFAMMNDV